jgi:hypothetical protein
VYLLTILYKRVAKMICQRCNSERIADVTSKCSDLCSIYFCGKEHNDYVPDDMGVGGGDYVKFKLCLDCGQQQGKWPLPKCEMEQDNNEEEE